MGWALEAERPAWARERRWEALGSHSVSSEFQAVAYGLCHNSTLPLGLPKSHRQHGNKRVWLASNRHLFMDTRHLNFIQLSHATKHSFDFISLNI